MDILRTRTLPDVQRIVMAPPVVVVSNSWNSHVNLLPRVQPPRAGLQTNHAQRDGLANGEMGCMLEQNASFATSIWISQMLH
jgi:hypothetical protein